MTTGAGLAYRGGMRHWVGVLCICAGLALAGLALSTAGDDSISESGAMLVAFAVIVAVIALVRLGIDLMRADRDDARP